MYTIQKNLTRFNNLGYSYFLDPNELRLLTSKLKKNEYSIYHSYIDSEKNIVYKKDIPEVCLYEIVSKVPIRHQDILGTIYSLDIASDLFGDILIIDNHYYIYILPILRNYFETNLLMIKNSHIELREVPVESFYEYERNYERIQLIVSSLRIDTVISSIMHIGRSNIDNLIKKKEILLNYDYLKNCDYKLHENDVFSIHRIGKFKYIGIDKMTKSDHLIIDIDKYV